MSLFSPSTFGSLLSLIRDTLAGAGALQGIPSKSAYQLAVQQGFAGTLEEWLNSLKCDEETDPVYLADKASIAFKADLPTDLSYLTNNGDDPYTQKSDLEPIKEVIPAQATASNQLGDKAFINSSINALAAFRVYRDAIKNDFTTRAELQAAILSGTFYRANGALYTPTTNDYTVITADEGAPAPFTDGQTRWKHFGDPIGWGYDYGLNNRPFTAAENAALGSNITLALVNKIANPDTSPTQNSANLITSGSVWAWFGAALSTLKTTAKTVIGAINELFDNKQSNIPASTSGYLATHSGTAGAFGTPKNPADFARVTQIAALASYTELSAAALALGEGTYHISGALMANMTDKPTTAYGGIGGAGCYLTIRKTTPVIGGGAISLEFMTIQNAETWRATLAANGTYATAWARITGGADTWETLTFTPAAGLSAAYTSFKLNRVTKQVQFVFTGFSVAAAGTAITQGMSLGTVAMPAGYEFTSSIYLPIMNMNYGTNGRTPCQVSVTGSSGNINLTLYGLDPNPYSGAWTVGVAEANKLYGSATTTIN